MQKQKNKESKNNPTPKDRVKDFWNRKPCGTLGVIPAEANLSYFKNIKKRRYNLEPFVKTLINSFGVDGKSVLEVGCGIGIDGLELVGGGADYAGVDISDRSVSLAQRYFELSGHKPNILVSDVENLPFSDSSFDFVYSWGAIHHTPDIKKAITEINRVLKTNGRFCIMIYNRYSLVGLQLYILYGLVRLRPFVSWKELFAKHHESEGTQAFTCKETKDLFADFSEVEIRDIVTPYDVRLARNLFLPGFLRRLIPSGLGFFKVVRGIKK